MSCNTCQSKFSLFTRENACPNCGFSFCSKCIKYKCEISNVGVKKVCGRCFSKFESKKNLKPITPTDGKSIFDAKNPEIQQLAPVDITNKLESLENPAKPPIVIYKGHWDKLKRGLEPADQEIVDRLRKLKGEDSQASPPSVEDIKRRLALLKDQDPERVNKPVNIYQVDTRTDQEKTDDLIKEYLERLKLSATNDPVSEIRSRLDRLKGSDPSKSSSKQEDDEEDDRSFSKKIIKKALAEAALEKKYEDVDELEEMEVELGHTSTDDEGRLSCVMCDQTADLVRCLGCHGDLYCTICFEDNHDDFELGRHKTVPFKPTKISKSN